MHSYARHLLQEVAVSAPSAAPTPAAAHAGNQRPSPSSAANSPANSPFHVGSQFSPTMVIILVILLSAFFFMGFFAIYVRRCTSEDSFSQRGNPRRGASRRHDGISGLHRAGVDPSLIENFPMVSYAAAKRKGCNECVVCLADFETGEELKQLPKCKHVFHPGCISMWLESHTTCPLCRRSLVSSERWSVSWRWGGSSRGGSLSARLNEGESSLSRRGGDQGAVSRGGSSRGRRIRLPPQNDDESQHAGAQEEYELAHGGSPFASPLTAEIVPLPNSAPSTSLPVCSKSLKIVAEDLHAGCSSFGLSEEVVAQQGSSRLSSEHAATQTAPTMQGVEGRSGLRRSNSTGHSLRKEVMNRAAAVAVAVQAAPLVVGCMPRSQFPLHRSRSTGLEEEEAMVGPDAATSDKSPVSEDGDARAPSTYAQ